MKNEILNIIKQAGEIMLDAKNLAIETKSTGVDLVTQIDKKVEDFLISYFKQILPNAKFVAEESLSNEKPEGDFWIIDPIDGTTNFVHGHPFCAISVALYLNNMPKYGIVYAPFLNEMFFAEKDKGAFLNGKPIKVSSCDSINKAILATGFPYNFATNPNNNINYLQHFRTVSQGIRRCGSAALDMAYVATGRLDAYWEWYVQTWDIAAGKILVEEAGGIVTDFDGKDFIFSRQMVLAAGANIYQKVLADIQKIRAKAEF